MQFHDLALIVCLDNAYCMDGQKRLGNFLMTPNAVANLDERLRAFETSLQSGAHAFAAPQLRRGLGRTSRSSDATSTIVERPLHYISSFSLLVR
jgi:hypothetical protein